MEDNKNQEGGRTAEDYLWSAIVVGSWLAIGASSYLRGFQDGSGVGGRYELAEHIIREGPYWPLWMYGIGMAIMGVGILVRLRWWERENWGGGDE